MKVQPLVLADLLFVTGAGVLLLGCDKPVEQPTPLESKSSAANKMTYLSHPIAVEVANAVQRVFKDAAVIESNRNPYFVTGDFNGDLSQDLAVEVKPAPARLAALNDELANWTLVDLIPNAIPPSKGLPDIHAAMARRRRVRVYEEDGLLAVIHGFQSRGWRSPQATQTYVLKNAAGGDMRIQSYTDLHRAHNTTKLPRMWGDVIAQTSGGQSGFLYYDGAKYAWYDPHYDKNFHIRR